MKSSPVRCSSNVEKDRGLCVYMDLFARFRFLAFNLIMDEAERGHGSQKR